MPTAVKQANSRIDIWKELKTIENVPTLPSVFFKLEKLLGDPKISIKSVVAVIEEDPPIVAKILQRINSGYYFFSKEINNIQQAIVLLGATEIRTLIAQLGVMEIFEGIADSPYFNFDKFWQHSSSTAHIAVAMCKHLGVNFNNNEFTASLLHDFGRLILCLYFYEIYQKVFRYSAERKISLLMAEKRMLNVTHTEVGGWLAQNWDLPEAVAEVIIFHHEVTIPDVQQHPLRAIVCVSDMLAGIWGYGLQPAPSLEALEGHSVWREMQRSFPKIQDFPAKDLEKILKMPADEAAESPQKERMARIKKSIVTMGLNQDAGHLIKALTMVRQGLQKQKLFLKEALGMLPKLFKRQLPFDMLTVYAYPSAEAGLEPLFQIGEPETIQDTVIFLRGKGLIRQVLQTGASLHATGAWKEDPPVETIVNSVLAVPLFAGNSFSGVVVLGSYRHQAYTDKEQVLLELCGEYLGLFMQMK